MRIALLCGALALSSSVLALNAASANTVIGKAWLNDPTGTGNATIANIPVTAPNATFSELSPLALQAGQNLVPYTLGGWVTSEACGAFITGASNASAGLDNTFFEFTGNVTVTTGETFTFQHDDGLTLVINGLTVVNAPGPTGAVSTTGTYTGAPGTFAFTLAYGEGCLAPAVLDVNLPLSSTPEPSTWAMMALGFAALGFAGYRARKTSVSIA